MHPKSYISEIWLFARNVYPKLLPSKLETVQVRVRVKPNALQLPMAAKT